MGWGNFRELEMHFLSEFSSFQVGLSIYTQGKFSRMEMQFLSKLSSFEAGLTCMRHGFQDILWAVFTIGAAVCKRILFIPSGTLWHSLLIWVGKIFRNCSCSF